MDPADERALERLIDEASGDEDVAAVLRFGSSVEDPQRARDVDVAVVFSQYADPASSQQLTYHAFSSGERHEGLDVSIFHDLPIYVRQRVLAEAEPILVNDEDELYEIAIATARAYERFRPFHRRYLEAVADA